MLLNSNYCIHIHFQYIDGPLVFVCVILTKNIYGGSPVSKIICESFERYHIKSSTCMIYLVNAWVVEHYYSSFVAIHI